MAFEAGTHVRHRTRPEWGVGRVDGHNGESVFVRFGDQLKTIKNSFADDFLTVVSPEELEAAKPKPRAGLAVGRTAQCPECGKDLRRGPDGEWRACVRCSPTPG